MFWETNSFPIFLFLLIFIKDTEIIADNYKIGLVTFFSLDIQQ